MSRMPLRGREWIGGRGDYIEKHVNHAEDSEKCGMIGIGKCYLEDNFCYIFFIQFILNRAT